MGQLVYPTHVCFDDALDLLVAILKAHQDSTKEVQADLAGNLYLCHGITNTLDRPSAHAWVEDQKMDTVLFVGIIDGKRTNLKGDRQEYYDQLKVSFVKRYSYQQAYWLNRLTNHYGPWLPQLRELCGRVDRERAVTP